MRIRPTYFVAASGIVAVGIVTLVLFCLRKPTVPVADVLSAYTEKVQHQVLGIRYPLDGTLLPPESVPPIFNWEDENPKSDAWVTSIKFQSDEDALNFSAYSPQWTPQERDWEGIKKRSLEKEAEVTILGVNRSSPAKILSAGQVKIRTSADEVGAPLFYREVNLPFVDAVKDPSHIRWRFGPISSPKPPPIILTNLPVCGNCHSFSQDLKTLAMDVDYANSKGSYVITRVAEEMVPATSAVSTNRVSCF